MQCSCNVVAMRRYVISLVKEWYLISGGDLVVALLPGSRLGHEAVEKMLNVDIVEVISGGIMSLRLRSS